MVQQYAEFLGEFTRLSVGRAGEKRGDMACFVATNFTLQSSLYQRNIIPT